MVVVRLGTESVARVGLLRRRPKAERIRLREVPKDESERRGDGAGEALPGNRPGHGRGRHPKGGARPEGSALSEGGGNGTPAWGTYE